MARRTARERVRIRVCLPVTATARPPPAEASDLRDAASCLAKINGDTVGGPWGREAVGVLRLHPPNFCELDPPDGLRSGSLWGS
jgi:hypothetical protein